MQAPAKGSRVQGPELMPAYSALEWESLFVAEAGASAALAGLLFVALSINWNGS
jgi:hypothetical protein